MTEFAEVVRSRRMTRAFTDRPIEVDVIDELGTGDSDSSGVDGVIVSAVGFVADHLEVFPLLLISGEFASNVLPVATTTRVIRLFNERATATTRALGCVARGTQLGVFRSMDGLLIIELLGSER